MSIEQPPKPDLRAVATNRIDLLLRRYGPGGAYDSVTNERAIYLLDDVTRELRQLRAQLADITEPGPLVTINRRVVALSRKVEAAVGKREPITTISATDATSVEDQPTQIVSPVAPLDASSDAARIKLEQEDREREQLFAEAERLSAELPAARAIASTTPLTTRVHELLNEIDRLRNLTSAARNLPKASERNTTPLDQLNRRVSDLRQSRALYDVYTAIAETIDLITEKRRLLLPDHPQRKIADSLLQLPNNVGLTPEQELAIMSQRLDELRQVNIIMALPDRTTGRYSLTQADIVQDQLGKLSAVPAQEVAVRGVSADRNEVVAVPLTTQLHRLLAVVFGHIRLLPRDRIRAQALQVANQARALLNAIEQASNRAQAEADQEPELRAYQQRLASLDQQLLAVIASKPAAAEEARTATMTRSTADVATADTAIQPDVEAVEVPIAGGLTDNGEWVSTQSEVVEMPAATATEAPPSSMETVTARLPEPERVHEPPVAPIAAIEPPEPVAPAAVQPATTEPVTLPDAATTPDSAVAMYRTKYRNLLRQQAQLEQKIATQGIWATLTRASNQTDLRRLQGTLERFRTAHPEVADVAAADLQHETHRAEELRYLEQSTDRHSTPAVRRTTSEKVVVLHKANAHDTLTTAAERTTSQRAERYEQRRRIPQEKSQPRFKVLSELNVLLDNPPGLLQSHTVWFSRLVEPERELVARTFHGEAATAIQYWQRKLEVLHEIRPAFFGRQRWQQEYDQAQVNLREAKQESTRWLEQRTAANRARAAA